MGNLLKILAKDESASKIDIFLDFENAQPTHPEFEVWQIVNSVLVHSDRVLEDLQKYRGAGEEIRQAISNPSHDQLQQIAWNAVVPLVAKLKGYYDYSLNLDKVTYQTHCNGQSDKVTDQTQCNDQSDKVTDQTHCNGESDKVTYQTHCNEQSDKVTNQTHCNDQSDKVTDQTHCNGESDKVTYQTHCNEQSDKVTTKLTNGDDGSDVNNEMANRMSLFYAQATPMLKMLSDATTRFVSENKNLPIENTTDLLSTMAAVCKTMLEHDAHYTRFKNEDTVLFCLRVMVGVIILYDHVHPVGAFDKKSSIDIKGCIKVLKVQHPTKVEGLLNALRYTSKHFNDDSTPKNIKAMLS
ncbi:CYFIP-related Rac1 interactor B-like [Saccoglossus kowalevskii]